jgi:hypothetical protein
MAMAVFYFVALSKNKDIVASHLILIGPVYLNRLQLQFAQVGRCLIDA